MIPMRDGIKLFTSIYIPKDTTLRYPIMLNRTPYYPIDWVNRNAMIGYWIAGDYQGKGIMTRACTALISYAFETLRLHRIDIRCATGNARRAVPFRDVSVSAMKEFCGKPNGCMITSWI